MKFIINALLVLLLGLCAYGAQQPERQVIVSYPKNTPESVLEAAKKAVEDAGGVIVHEYNIIMGFAAKAPAKIFETIETMGAEHNVLVESDSVVGIGNDNVS